MKKDIRLEAIGGQGANSAGKIFAEAAVLGMGFTGNHYSSFGSEKRGSPIRSSIRYRDDGHAIRSAAPILRPDCLVLFHQSLIDHSISACEGSQSDTLVLVNTAQLPNQILFPEGFVAKTVASVDALAISRKYSVGINSVMLGALSRFCPEIRQEILEAAFKEFFSHLAPVVLEKNIQALREGALKVRSARYDASFLRSQSRVHIQKVKLPVLGYENGPIGGVVVNPGNTILRDLSHSRKGTIPKLDYQKCIHCGQCDMVCPDFCFVWQRSMIEDPVVTSPTGVEKKTIQQLGVPVLAGIDYRYCKGCQKCIEACPQSALSLVEDTEKNRNYSGAHRFEAKTTEAVYPVYTENED